MKLENCMNTVTNKRINIQSKIAFGIPFKASKYTEAIELCLMSIQQYATFE